MKNFLMASLLSLAALFAAPQAQAYCDNCGRITHIEAYTGHRSGTGGAVAGAVVGGLLGNQIGGGDGKKVATVAGAVGGAYAGKHIAENSEKTKYRVTVRMEDGHSETVTQSSVGNLRVGSSVRIKNGKAVWR
jgi:outer membrane lipoprotein SlyB